jgi:hypothetical protein
MGLRDWLSGGTKCSTDDFELRLAGTWRPDHEPTHYGFVHEAEGEQVTVSALRTRERLEKPALLLAALRLVAIRQKAYLQMSGGAASFTEPQSTEVGEGIDVSFSVSNSAGQVQSRVWVLARPHRIVTVAFNRYSPLLGAADFDQRSSQVRAGLSVR